MISNNITLRARSLQKFNEQNYKYNQRPVKSVLQSGFNSFIIFTALKHVFKHENLLQKNSTFVKI